MDDLQFPHLVAVLERYGQLYADSYRSRLAEEGIDASGALSRSVDFVVSRPGRTYELSLSLEDYWRYVEDGRRPGKFPPPSAILRWIRVKPVVPHPGADGRIPTERSLAYLIGRKIARDGIPPKHVYAKTDRVLRNDMEEAIREAVEADIGRAVDDILAYIVDG